MNVKELIENRNAKVAQMEGLLTTAKAENRLPSDEEKKQFNRIASFKGSVTQIHDDLIRKYIQDNKSLLEASNDK